MNLLGRLTDPEFWKTVRNDEFYASYTKEIKDSWDELCVGKIPQLLYSEFNLTWTTGDRDTYQKPYFHKRGILNAAAILSLIYPEEEKYFTKLQDIIFDICNEYTWCLPAHFDADGKKDPYSVDLFAAETGFSLAEIYTLHKDRLDPFIKSLLLSSVSKRVIDPTLLRTNGWWWERMHNNWLAVCAGSVGCTAMLLFPGAFEAIKPRIDKAMEVYIESFLGDGTCLEGCSYWDYGFGFFTVYADMLKNYTEGKEDYFKRDDVKAIAAFPQKMFLSEDCAVSFSDMGASFKPSISILHYLKQIYPDTVKLPRLEYCTYGVGRWRTSYILRAATWINKEYTKRDEIGNDSNYFYFAKSQWYVNKTRQYGFAAKGGHNKEPHNHLDVGSFIFAKNGRQIFADLGSGLYTMDYFSDKRYESFEPSSFSHSQPIISGEGQKPGIEYAAKNICATDSSFSLDIADAYAIDGVKSILRRFDILEEGIKLTDKFLLTEEKAITERFVTYAQPRVICEGEIEVDGSLLSYGDEVESCKIEKVVTPVHECYVIDLVLRDTSSTFTCTVK